MTHDNPLEESACCPTCVAAIDAGRDLPKSCSLSPAGLDLRLSEIRDLADRHLLGSERQGLSLRLTYRAEALDEVRALVAQEYDCCGFLSFAVDARPEAAILRLSSPEHARGAADQLLDAFEGSKGPAQ